MMWRFIRGGELIELTLVKMSRFFEISPQLWTKCVRVVYIKPRCLIKINLCVSKKMHLFIKIVKEIKY